MTRVGIYAGTFDPVHNGHIAFAQEALKTGLDRVVFLPERMPRSKPSVTDYAHRVAMLQLAVQDHPGLEVAQMSHDQFTVGHTLPELRKQFGDDLTLLMGSDVAATLVNWQNVETLLEQTALLIALRRDHTQADVALNVKRAGQNARFVCIPSPAPHTSSRDIREKTPHNQLHPTVKNYASQHALYKK